MCACPSLPFVVECGQGVISTKYKRIIFSFVFLLLLLIPLTAETAYAYTVPSDTIVYVTNTGSKYHRAGCSYLKSSRSMTIAQAVAAGYSPCSRCHPGQLTGNYVSDWNGKSGGSGSSAGSGKDVAKVTPTPSPEPQEEQECFPLFLVICGAAVALFVTWRIIRSCKKRKAEKERQLRKRLAAEERQRQAKIRERERQKRQKEAEEQIRRAFIEAKEKFTALYGGQSAESLAGIPSNVEIGPDGLPKSPGPGNWGPRFTFYISPSGKSFHCICGCSNAYTPAHAVKVGRYGYAPCKRCAPQLPDLSWYHKYLDIRAIKAKYEIN